PSPANPVACAGSRAPGATRVRRRVLPDLRAGAGHGALAVRVLPAGGPARPVLVRGPRRERRRELLPIGYAEEDRQHIMMAADGRVFMDNSPNECFVAAAPDEAIVVLAQGRALTFI